MPTSSREDFVNGLLGEIKNAPVVAIPGQTAIT